MEKIEIDYHELKNLIKNGLLESNKDDFIGMALLKSTIHMHNQEKWDEMISLLLDNMAYSVIVNLKAQFKQQLVITEDNCEIMQDMED